MNRDCSEDDLLAGRVDGNIVDLAEIKSIFSYVEVHGNIKSQRARMLDSVHNSSDQRVRCISVNRHGALRRVFIRHVQVLPIACAAGRFAPTADTAAWTCDVDPGGKPLLPHEARNTALTDAAATLLNACMV